MAARAVTARSSSRTGEKKRSVFFFLLFLFGIRVVSRRPAIARSTQRYRGAPHLPAHGNRFRAKIGGGSRPSRTRSEMRLRRDEARYDVQSHERGLARVRARTRAPCQDAPVVQGDPLSCERVPLFRTVSVDLCTLERGMEVGGGEGGGGSSDFLELCTRRRLRLASSNRGDRKELRHRH